MPTGQTSHPTQHPPLTRQEIREITDVVLGPLEYDHSFVQLIRDLEHENYHLGEHLTHLRQRLTRQRQLAVRQQQLAVNTLYSSVKEELEFYTDLTADREVEIAIELLTTSIQCLDAEKFIADSLPEQDGYDSYSS